MILFIPAIETESDLSKRANRFDEMLRNSQITTAYFFRKLTFLYMAQDNAFFLSTSVRVRVESYWLQNEF